MALHMDARRKLQRRRQPPLHQRLKHQPKHQLRLLLLKNPQLKKRHMTMTITAMITETMETTEIMETIMRKLKR